MKAKPNPLDILKALQSVDKPMSKSKKFVAFAFIQLSWKVLLGYGIYIGLDSTVLMAMVAAAGTSETAYLGAQAWHDKHVKGDKMKAMNGSVTKALEMTEEEPTDGGE